MKPILAAALLLGAVWVADASGMPQSFAGAQAAAVPANTKTEFTTLEDVLSDPHTSGAGKANPVPVSKKSVTSPLPAVPTPPLPAVAVAPVQAPPQTEEPQNTGPAPASVADCVVPLQELVNFHNKEIASLREMIDRWNAKVESAFKRRQSLDRDVHARLLKVDTLLLQDTRASKHEANRLKKEIKRINKEIASVDKELSMQSRELAEEVRDVSKDAQQALRDAYQKVSQDIQKTHN